jgi:sigma-70-like protein
MTDMSQLEELPPDQRAALSLLVRQRKSYAEVARMLQIPASAVHDRAQAALAVLAPGEARALTAERREEVGDYLLGQAGIADRLKTRTYLTDSEPARNWARAVASELAPLNGQLPEIPAPPTNDVPHATQAAAVQPPAVQPPAATPSGPPADAGGTHPRTPLPSAPSSSRLGGALVVAAVVVAIIVAVILLTGGSSKHRKTASTKTTTSARGPAVHQLALSSPAPKSRSVGVVEVLSEGGKRAFYIEADNIPPSKHFFYAIWLYNSPTSAEPLSKAPPVGNSKRLAGGALLPADAGNYKRILLTRETDTHPTHPGKVVLEGPFSLE